MTIIFVMLGCILIEAFFSGSEMAIVSVDRAQLNYWVKKGSKRAKLLHDTLKNPEWLLGTTLLGTNLAVTTLNTVATLYVIHRFGSTYEFLTAVVTIPFILLLGETLPKNFAQAYANKIAYTVIVPLRVISYFVWPLTKIITYSGKAIKRVTGGQPHTNLPFLTREEVEFLFKANEKNRTVKDLEKKMIYKVFSFSGKKGRDILIPLIDVVALRNTFKLSEAKKIFQASGYSRIPVYADRIDNMVGWVNHYDLLKNLDDNRSISEIMRPIYFMPVAAELGKILLKMQRLGESMVILVDEYGGVAGMVTLEDVIEEVVGDIEDEYDFGSQYVQQVLKDKIVVQAKIPLLKLEEIFGLTFPKTDLDTLNGYLQDVFQDIPKKGDRTRIGKHEFIVLEANDRRVESVEIRL